MAKQTVSFERVDIDPEFLAGVIEIIQSPDLSFSEMERLKCEYVQPWMLPHDSVSARLVELRAGSAMQIQRSRVPGALAVWSQLEGQSGLRGGGMRERMNTRIIAQTGDAILKTGSGKLSVEAELGHSSIGVLIEVEPRG